MCSLRLRSFGLQMEGPLTVAASTTKVGSGDEAVHFVLEETIEQIPKVVEFINLKKECACGLIIV